MKIGATSLSTILLMAACMNLGSASPSTAPAFLWSPYIQSLNSKLREVNYQIVHPKDLASSVLSQGGWSNFMCAGKQLGEPIDLALVFIGRGLHSLDVSGSSDPSLVGLLKDSFTASNFSVAFPYVAVPAEERMENLLLSGFKEACGQSLGINDVVFSESCSLEGRSSPNVADLQSLHDRLLTRKKIEGKTDLIVYCSQELHETSEESQTFSELMNSVKQSSSKYSALYVSDPYHHSHELLRRFLAESNSKNTSVNATAGCDEVCKLKASLLEGVLVAIVLLLILISGLCCMAGIDTPTRFETPQES